MCGIVGMISKNPSGFYMKDAALLDQMLYADALRGDDSTGLFGVTTEGNVHLLKEASCSTIFMADKKYDEFQRTMISNMKFVVGHNRSSTKGSITDKNAHPFNEGDITLVHNGTLWTHKHLKDVDVDSHAICHIINERGAQQALNDILGAYALVWYDNKDQSLYLARNKERPLHILETYTIYYIASEINMLYWLLSRNGISIGEKDAKHIPIEIDNLYQIKLGNPKELVKIPLEQLPVTPHKVEKINKKLLPFKPTAPKGDYTIGETILFTFSKVETQQEAGNWPENKKHPDTSARFIGKTGWSSVEVQAYTSEDKAIQLVAASVNDVLKGTIKYSVSKKGKVVQLIVEDLSVPEVTVSKNGIKITPDIWISISHACDTCYTVIGGAEIPEAEIEVIKNQDGFYRKKRITCGSCLSGDYDNYYSNTYYTGYC